MHLETGSKAGGNLLVCRGSHHWTPFPTSGLLAPDCRRFQEPIKVHKKAGGDGARAGKIKAAGDEEGEGEDIPLECKDCGAEFVFSVGEQAFYKEKGFDNQPARSRALSRSPSSPAVSNRI